MPVKYVDFHRKYIKQWTKLTRPQQQKIESAIELLKNHPDAPQIRLHQLKGSYYPQYSISAGGDLRAHFLWVSEDTVVFMAVGTHSQLYG